MRSRTRGTCYLGSFVAAGSRNTRECSAAYSDNLPYVLNLLNTIPGTQLNGALPARLTLGSP